MNAIEKIAKCRWFSTEDTNQASGAWHAMNYARLHKDVTVVELDGEDDNDVLLFGMTPDEVQELVKTWPLDT